MIDRLDGILNRAITIDLEAEREFVEKRHATKLIEQVLHDMTAIDAKSGALLAHISMMIAAIGALLGSNITPSKPSDLVLVLEMVVYVVCAVLLLRCLDVMGPPHRKLPEGTQEREAFYFHEVGLRRSIFVGVLRAVVVTTIALVPSVLFRFFASH